MQSVASLNRASVSLNSPELHRHLMQFRLLEGRRLSLLGHAASFHILAFSLFGFALTFSRCAFARPQSHASQSSSRGDFRASQPDYGERLAHPHVLCSLSPRRAFYGGMTARCFSVVHRFSSAMVADENKNQSCQP